MDCENQPCTKKVGQVNNWQTDLRIIEVTRIKRKWFLPDQDAPDAQEENVPPDGIDPQLVEKIREEFGPNPGAGSPEGMPLEDFCLEIGLTGCYCKVAPGAVPQAVGQLQQDYTRDYYYVVEDTVGSPNWDANPRVVRDAADNITTIDPIVHELELVVDGAGQPVLPIRYHRRTRYFAKVKFNLKMSIVSYRGVCTPVRELAEEEDNYYFVRRPRDPRRGYV